MQVLEDKIKELKKRNQCLMDNNNEMILLSEEKEVFIKSLEKKLDEGLLKDNIEHDTVSLLIFPNM